MSVAELIRRTRASNLIQSVLVNTHQNDDDGAELAVVKTTLDAVAFVEYLKRGNTGKMVLKVFIPVLSGVGIVTIGTGVDVKLTAEVADTRWNGTFAVNDGGTLALHRL